MRSLILLALAVVAVGVSYSDACSCMPTHPQTTYCNAEYGKEKKRIPVVNREFLKNCFSEERNWLTERLFFLLLLLFQLLSPKFYESLTSATIRLCTKWSSRRSTRWVGGGGGGFLIETAETLGIKKRNSFIELFLPGVCIANVEFYSVLLSDESQSIERALKRSSLHGKHRLTLRCAVKGRRSLYNNGKFRQDQFLQLHQGIFVRDDCGATWNRRCLQEGLRLWCDALLEAGSLRTGRRWMLVEPVERMPDTIWLVHPQSGNFQRRRKAHKVPLAKEQPVPQLYQQVAESCLRFCHFLPAFPPVLLLFIYLPPYTHTQISIVPTCMQLIHNRVQRVF